MQPVSELVGTRRPPIHRCVCCRSDMTGVVHITPQAVCGGPRVAGALLLAAHVQAGCCAHRRGDRSSKGAELVERVTRQASRLRGCVGASEIARRAPCTSGALARGGRAPCAVKRLRGRAGPAPIVAHVGPRSGGRSRPPPDHGRACRNSRPIRAVCTSTRVTGIRSRAVSGPGREAAERSGLRRRWV